MEGRALQGAGWAWWEAGFWGTGQEPGFWIYDKEQVAMQSMQSGGGLNFPHQGDRTQPMERKKMWRDERR